MPIVVAVPLFAAVGAVSVYPVIVGVVIVGLVENTIFVLVVPVAPEAV